MRAEEDIVPQHQRDIVVADEVRADRERLRQPLGLGLFGIADLQPQLRSVAEDVAVVADEFWA